VEYIPEVIIDSSPAGGDAKVSGGVGVSCGGGFKGTADEDASSGTEELKEVRVELRGHTKPAASAKMNHNCCATMKRLSKMHCEVMVELSVNGRKINTMTKGEEDRRNIIGTCPRRTKVSPVPCCKQQDQKEK